MNRTRRIGAALAVALVALAACGDDDNDTTDTTAAAVATTDAAASTDVATTVATGGEPNESTEAPATTSAATDHSAHEEAQTITVNAVDYHFEDVPASVPAGTSLSMHNASTKEVHELVAFRIPDSETRPVHELVTLPEEELGALFGGEPALVLVAAPGEDGTPVVGDGTLTEPGRYVVICAIPIGADPEEFLSAAQSSDAPPEVAGGPPHFTAGMFTELTVD